MFSCMQSSLRSENRYIDNLLIQCSKYALLKSMTSVQYRAHHARLLRPWEKVQSHKRPSSEGGNSRRRYTWIASLIHFFLVKSLDPEVRANGLFIDPKSVHHQHTRREQSGKCHDVNDK